MLLVLVALASVAIQSCVAADDPSAKDEVVSINPLTSVYIGVEDDFMLACSINMPDLRLTLIIDSSTNNPKMKRIKSEPFSNHSKEAILYTFQDVAPADNGTTFFCLAINDTSMSTSSVLTLHVVAINITSLTGPGVEVDDDFMFACWVDQPDLQLSLIIDDTTESPKMDRVITENFPRNDTDSGRVYTFKNIEPGDNGTTFFCVASEGNQAFASDVVTMEAIATPLFVAGSNQSRYNFIYLGVNGYLNCKIFYSNPPLLNLSLANNSKNTENFKFDSLAGRVVFTKAKVNNRGNYTCTATNALGSTYLTFETFIGGAPNNVSVGVMEETVNQSIVLSFSINDMSDAPALNVTIKLMGVIETMLDFKDKGLHIPVDHTFHNVVLVDREDVYAAYYSVVVTASNELGDKTAKREMAFLNGTLPLEITIDPSSLNVTEGHRYSFECKAHPKNMSNVSIPFTVLINGSSDGPLQKRLVKESSSPLSQKFHFQNVSVADEGVSFACVGSGVYVSKLTNFTVLYAPKSMSPVTVPTKTVGDAPFTITVSYTAKPAVTFTQWRRNGVMINNDTRIIPSLNRLQFLLVVPIDNGSYTVTLFNEVGNTTIPFDMIVNYPPILSVKDQLGGFLNRSLVVKVSVDANPTNYTASWFINSKPLVPGSNIKVKGATIMFSNLTKSNIANYTVEVSNGIGNKSNAFFQLVAYDGPNFKESTSNSTMLIEREIGLDFNLTCTIKSAYPKVQELTIIPEKGPNWKIYKDPGLKSATLVFTKAEADNNTKKFTCIAKNNFTMSTLTFDNYVGGPPSGVEVKNIYKNSTINSVTLNVEVVDNSHVPATGILFSVKGFSKTNTSKQMPYPPSNKSVMFKDVFNATFDELGNSTTYVLKVYARNMIGVVFVTDYTFTIPAKQKHEVVSIKPLTGVYIEVKNDFMFACSVNDPDHLNLTLIIDNSTSSPKMKRVKSDPLPNDTSGAVYTFQDVALADNGTTFFCRASNTTVNSTSSVLTLQIVDGPYFKEGASNSTILAEHKTGLDFNLTCTIESANPKVQELTIIPEQGPNWKIHKDPGLKSATLVFTEAEAENNTKKFTCIAKNNFTMSTLTFDNYVGGPSSSVKVNVTKNLTSDSVTLSVEVYDDSHVPATEILFSVRGSKANTSKQMPYPAANDSSTVLFKNVFSATFDELSSSTVYVLNIYAVNKIGIVFVTDYNFTIPAKQKHKNFNSGAIAAGVLVPLAVISLIVIVVIGYIYYRRKHKQRRFTLLPDGDDGTINNPVAGL